MCRYDDKVWWFWIKLICNVYMLIWSSLMWNYTLSYEGGFMRIMMWVIKLILSLRRWNWCINVWDCIECLEI